MPPTQLQARKDSMSEAVKAGYDVLARGGSSLDAVEAAICILEDSGQFDAGRGGYYTREGVPELDASIMDGRTLQAGAVASLKHTANPISLARMVMERTPHVMLEVPAPRSSLVRKASSSSRRITSTRRANGHDLKTR
jgi:beta-aspartyl-peptidase (threonine type)